ncbi:MAG: translation initiation factor IF-2 [Firmicutes bacterium]|nr:translation initiation factor IF-2 [Bacillota bacterium]
MPPVQRRAIISGPIMVKELADQLGVKSNELIKRLIGLGVMATVNHDLDRETAVIVATEYGAEVEERASVEEREEILIQGAEDSPESLQSRPPVVTVMGHVDHGKTSLLDRIRSSRVTQSEAGGITQHIGASVISWHDHEIVFLDTPGHDAFTAVPVSARTGEGLDQLLEAIVLQAQLLELQANPDRPAQGVIIEAKLDKGRGPVATVLVKRGTLKVGDVFLAGTVFGRVRALLTDQGERIAEAGPSIPVEVLGFNQLPDAGDDFVILTDERQAKDIADARAERTRRAADEGTRGVSLDEFYQRLKDEEVRDLNLVIKADVHGSSEALSQSLSKLSHSEARVRVLHTGVGSITETDVMLAQASGAIVIGFGVGLESKARQIAEREHVDVRTYRVIYEIIEDVERALKGMLSPKFQEIILGRAEVREVFRVPRIGAVGGCYVVDGKVLRTAQVRLLRDGAVIHEGPIASLKRFKDDVREVASGFECGIGLERFNDIKVGDVMEVFTEEEVKAS